MTVSTKTKGVVFEDCQTKIVKTLAQVCPSAMIFIPCKDGISHNEIEDATPEDVAAGCDVLLQAILEKATE